MPALPRFSRWTAVAIAMLGASALAIAVQGGRWWSLGEVTIGPAGSHNCFDGDCRAGGLAWLDGGDLFLRSGMATWAAGLIVAATLVVLAAGVAAGRAPKLAAQTVIVASLTAAVAGALFIAKFPGLAGVRVDRGLVCYVCGVAIALVAAILVLRARPVAT